MDSIKIAFKTHFDKLAIIKNHCYSKIGSLQVEFYKTKEPVDFSQIDLSKLRPIQKYQSWSNESYDCAWFKIKGKVESKYIGENLAVLLALGGEGEVRDNFGNPIIGLTGINSVLECLQPKIGKRLIRLSKQIINEKGEIDFWVEAGNNKIKTRHKILNCYLTQSDIVIEHKQTKAYYYDCLALIMQMYAAPKNQNCKHIKKALNKSYSLLGNYSEKNVVSARSELKKVQNKNQKNDFTSYGVGHAHLDLAYLWPIRETKRKAVRTFSNALANIDVYDDYIFGSSQAQQFEWIKENEPFLFEKIKAAVHSGKLEIQGGMWVESDCNIPSGESLIRQNLYGQKFWQENFGFTNKICWLPDAFGFNANLPQICKKSGMDYFMTTKISWNTQTKFPHATFNWQGIDGTVVLTAFPPENDYNGSGDALTLKKSRNNLIEKDKLKFFLTTYGTGDGGGGPGEGHIELYNRNDFLPYSPNAKSAKALDYFEKLEFYKKELKTHEGDLYLEKHQGTFTTQGKNKYYNRKLEFLLHNLEFLSVLASRKGYIFPKEEIDKIWKEILLYQFHDIIPGSAIERVYTESVKRYQQIENQLYKIIEDMSVYFEKSTDIYSLNNTSFDFEGYIFKNNKSYFAKIPAYSSAKLQEVNDAVNGLKSKENKLENDIVHLRFGENGEIVSLIHKASLKQYSLNGLNKLVIYDDKKMHYNAWDISTDYLKSNGESLKLISSENSKTNVSVSRVNTYQYNKSKIIQTITLVKGSDLIECDTKIDWNETHKMLRADFYSEIYADEVCCDIQMGKFKRSTKEISKVEKAQFEIPAQKYVKLVDEKYGIAYITDSKYGWRVKNGLVSLNLLRSPVYPDKNADKGEHHFKYALYSFKAQDDQTDKIAYHFNNEMKIIDYSVCDKSFVKSSNSAIIIETVKLAYSDDSIILRLYESQGKKNSANISLDIEKFDSYETDMLEETIRKTSLENLEFTPFEIKTIKIIENK